MRPLVPRPERGEQGAAARTQLDQTERRRRAQVPPRLGEPRPDHLAECLAELRRGDEVALRPEGITRAVVAAGRVVEREVHEAADGQRPLAPDHLGEDRLKVAQGPPAPGRSCA